MRTTQQSKRQPGSKLEPGFAELQVSARAMIIIVVVAALVLQMVSEDLYPDTLRQSRVQLFGMLLSVLLGAAWLLHNWKPRLGHWFTIIVLALMVHLGGWWLEISGFLTLLVVPVALAVPLLGLSGTAVLVVGETALLLWARGHVAALAESPDTAVALVAVWIIFGIMYVIYRPVYEIARWSWDYYRRGSDLFEQAADRTVKMKQALDDLAHLNRQLALANERLASLRLIAEEAQKTKAAFVAKVSHEFRTPLHMIIGLIDLMVASPEVYAQELPAGVAEDLRIVRRNCEHLSDLVNDVLALSQAEAGRLALKRERVALAEIVWDALAVVHPLIEKKGLRLEVTIPEDLPPIYCDRTRIRQVILNLISNAARFTEQGSIAVRVSAQDPHVIVSVSDTGPGIPPEDKERIFEPFCQGTARLWRDKSGSGLGLSISRQFVELHDGRIWVESELGKGTTFSFTLPISPLEHAAPAWRWISEAWPWVERTSRPSLPDQQLRPRAIICDSTGDLQRTLARYTDEVEFIAAADLTQVAKEIDACPAHFVLLNAASPEEIWPLAAQARRDLPGTPVIGCAVPPPVENRLQGGVVGFLVKPVSRSGLEEAIGALRRPVRHVLVVDDDPDVLQLWTRMLLAYDSEMEVTAVRSGSEALQEMRSRPPDLVLLDIVMPEMDGWQVLNTKDQQEDLRDIPTIIVSAQDPREQPLASQALLVTTSDGLPLSKLLRCSLEVSALLLKPD